MAETCSRQPLYIYICIYIHIYIILYIYIYVYIYTGNTQKNDVVSKVNGKFNSHLTRAQRTPSAAATVHVFRALTL